MNILSLKKLYIKFSNFKNRLRVIIYKFLYGRNLNLTKLNISMGKLSNIIINDDGKIYLGENIEFRNLCTISASEKGVINIASNCFFNTNCRIISHSSINIGENCIFGPNVSIYDHDHRFDIPLVPIKDQGFISENVKIGKDVWVGANVIITSGVNIGDRVIIGANSVVTKSLKSNGIYAGIPAKKIKNLQ